jgi:SOS response regulatory protein OraA/RecX
VRNAPGARPAKRRTLTAFDVACRWLARAPRSAAEVRLRLASLGFSARAVDDALRRLLDLCYLDDAALARQRAETLAGRGYGDAWIAADLERHAVPAADIEAAVGALPPEPERARRWLRRRYRGRVPKSAWRELLARGFAEGAVESVLGSALPD